MNHIVNAAPRAHGRMWGPLLAVVVLTLAACTEKPQTTHRKADDAPWADTHTAFLVPGYRPGDKAAWLAQLHQRVLRQNEYLRVRLAP